MFVYLTDSSFSQDEQRAFYPCYPVMESDTGIGTMSEEYDATFLATSPAAAIKRIVTVAEMIAELSKLDPTLPILGYDSDSGDYVPAYRPNVGTMRTHDGVRFDPDGYGATTINAVLI